jgi:hypothetical protein
MQTGPIVWVWSKLFIAHQPASHLRRIGAALESLGSSCDRIVSPRAGIRDVFVIDLEVEKILEHYHVRRSDLRTQFLTRSSHAER